MDGIIEDQAGLTALTGQKDVSGNNKQETGTGAVAAPLEARGGVDPLDEPFEWDRDAPAGASTHALCRRLARVGTLYRTMSGTLMRLEPGKAPQEITTATQLEGYIRSHVNIVTIKNGKQAGSAVPSSDLAIILATSDLQRELPVVDRVTDVVTYTSDWTLTKPGYNAGGEGDRIYYTGKAVTPKRTPDRIRQFLGAMSFKSPSDATNAVALGLTVLMRFKWKGNKPFAAVTANKSHAGKDTVVDFACGRTRRVEISYHATDWALQNEAVAALADPNAGVLAIGNVRSASGPIASAFIERTVTSPDSLMQSSKRRGDGYRRDGDFVVVATANMGRFSPDLSNRSLPIELEVIGDIAGRAPAIGNPRHEFLPDYVEEIQAEFCGMIENWKDDGMPLDTNARHPMKQWAETNGGILKVNGFEGFLDNWQFQRSANDPLREALALLADGSQAGQWLRVGDLVKTARKLGLERDLMDSRHTHNDKAMERQLGVVLTAHRDETVHADTDDGRKSFTIQKDRNVSTGALATVYRFMPAGQ